MNENDLSLVEMIGEIILQRKKSNTIYIRRQSYISTTGRVLGTQGQLYTCYLSVIIDRIVTSYILPVWTMHYMINYIIGT